MSLTLSVIVPTHDRPEALETVIDSLLRQTRPPNELIVVNDGAAELDSALVQRGQAAGVGFCTLRRSAPSSAASRNEGLQRARGDVAVLLDDDTEAPPDFLARLESLYEADRAGVVAGICGRYVEQPPPRWTNRLWATIAAALAENRWAPRVSVARYVRLPGALAGRLRPAWRFVGGAMSLRKRVYTRYRFTEAFPGYSLAEDTELSFRIGAVEALFVAPELTVLHHKSPTGRPDPYRRGRMYAAHMVHIAEHTVPGGAGTWLLLGYHLAGMVLLASAWSLLSWRGPAAARRGGHNAHLAAGIAAELFCRLRDGAKRLLCGC